MAANASRVPVRTRDTRGNAITGRWLFSPACTSARRNSMVARDNLAALSPVTRDYSHFMADLTSSVDTGVSVCTRAPQEKLSAGFHPFSPRTHPSRVSPSREIPRRAYTDKSSAGSFDGENSSWRDYKGNREACRRGTATGAVLRTSSRFKDFLNGPPPLVILVFFSLPPSFCSRWISCEGWFRTRRHYASARAPHPFIWPGNYS